LLRYYLWPLAEKTLSFLPGGNAIYKYTGERVNKDRKGYGLQFATSLPLARKTRELVRPGGVVLDLGTGWFHHDAFLIYLIGDFEIVVFDIEDKARIFYIHNYLRNLLENIELVAKELEVDERVAAEKLRELLSLADRDAIYDRCNFKVCISENVDALFLPERSVDFIVSNCVLVHIRPQTLIPELVNLRRMLTDNGYMYHLLGHDDHWAFHDPSMTWPSFNYYRYSDLVYRLLFETKFEYQNRLARSEWLTLFGECGLDVAEYNAVVTDDSRDAIRKLRRVSRRLAQYPVDELAIIYSYVLLSKQPQFQIAQTGTDAGAFESASASRAAETFGQVGIGSPLVDRRPVDRAASS
jgi:hypothetical protein